MNPTPPISCTSPRVPAAQVSVAQPGQLRSCTAPPCCAGLPHTSSQTPRSLIPPPLLCHGIVKPNSEIRSITPPRCIGSVACPTSDTRETRARAGGSQPQLALPVLPHGACDAVGYLADCATPKSATPVSTLRCLTPGDASPRVRAPRGYITSCNVVVPGDATPRNLIPRRLQIPVDVQVQARRRDASAPTMSQFVSPPCHEGAWLADGETNMAARWAVPGGSANAVAAPVSGHPPPPQFAPTHTTLPQGSSARVFRPPVPSAGCHVAAQVHSNMPESGQRPSCGLAQGQVTPPVEFDPDATTEIDPDHLWAGVLERLARKSSSTGAPLAAHRPPAGCAGTLVTENWEHHSESSTVASTQDPVDSWPSRTAFVGRLRRHDDTNVPLPVASAKSSVRDFASPSPALPPAPDLCATPDLHLARAALARGFRDGGVPRDRAVADCGSAPERGKPQAFDALAAVQRPDLGAQANDIRRRRDSLRAPPERACEDVPSRRCALPGRQETQLV